MENWEKYYGDFPNQKPESFRKPKFVLQISSWGQNEGEEAHLYGFLSVDGGEPIPLEHELSEKEAISISIKYRNLDDESHKRWTQMNEGGKALSSPRFFDKETLIAKAREKAREITSEKKRQSGYSTQVDENDYHFEIDDRTKT